MEESRSGEGDGDEEEEEKEGEVLVGEGALVGDEGEVEGACQGVVEVVLGEAYGVGSVD